MFPHIRYFPFCRFPSLFFLFSFSSPSIHLSIHPRSLSPSLISTHLHSPLSPPLSLQSPSSPPLTSDILDCVLTDGKEIHQLLFTTKPHPFNRTFHSRLPLPVLLRHRFFNFPSSLQRTVVIFPCKWLFIQKTCLSRSTRSSTQFTQKSRPLHAPCLLLPSSHSLPSLLDAISATSRTRPRELLLLHHHHLMKS